MSVTLDALTLSKSQKFTKVIFHYIKTKQKQGAHIIYMSRLWEKTGKFRDATLSITYRFQQNMYTKRKILHSIRILGLKW